MHARALSRGPVPPRRDPLGARSHGGAVFAGRPRERRPASAGSRLGGPAREAVDTDTPDVTIKGG
eukprot:8149778-Pyramimonas_sp.AAC.1